ncbi:MAG: hypothetical protein AAF804_12190 [Bacteroidota bacterium]
MNQPIVNLLAAIGMSVLLMACRPDPEIIEVPVPFEIDSLALLPQWENHPGFFGVDKVQWANWSDESLCLLVGNSESNFLQAGGSISAAWEGYALSSQHSNPHYKPSLSRDWLVLQDVSRGTLFIGHPLIGNTRTFLNLSDHPQTKTLSFLSWKHWLPSTYAGTFIKTTPSEFAWVGWAKDTNDIMGLVYVEGSLSSLPGNPALNRIEWNPLPSSELSIASPIAPAFLAQVGDAVLVGIGNSPDSTALFGEQLFLWRPGQGYERIPADRYGSTALRTAFSASDGQTAYLMLDDGDLHQVRANGSFTLIFEGLYNYEVSHLSAAKDLRGYFAFFFHDNLALWDKAIANLWLSPNLGLDGHSIADVTLFQDTLLISSQTGGIFYQALSEVWPEDQR